MRAMLPNGSVLSLSKAIPIAELKVAFNGRDMRFSEKAADIAYANAIAFITEGGVQDICDVTMGGTVLLGNLSNDFVRGVLSSLVRQGYTDLSDLKLQKTQPLVSQYKFDNGASGAYMLQGYEASASFAAVPFMGMGGAFPAVSEAEDAEDAEDDEDAGEEDEQ